MKLITHDGTFHADDVLSTVVLRYMFPNAEIVRTRDPELISPKSGGQRIIYDVGGAYSGDDKIYDHHQNDAPLRVDGIPYSSFGLIWKHYGHDYLAKKGFHLPILGQLHEDLDMNFVRHIDRMDNGILPRFDSPLDRETFYGVNLSILIENLYPAVSDPMPAEENGAFMEAVAVMNTLLNATTQKFARNLLMAEKVKAAIDAQWGNSILVLDEACSYRGAIEEMQADHIMFVVFPATPGYAVRVVTKSPRVFDARMDLPEDWAGLLGSELDQVTGIPGGVFCHKARFIAIHENLEGAMKMAESAVLGFAEQSRPPAP